MVPPARSLPVSDMSDHDYGILLRHSRATVDPDRERLSTPLERCTEDQEPADLQADQAKLNPQRSASNPGSGTEQASNPRDFVDVGVRCAGQSRRLARGLPRFVLAVGKVAPEPVPIADGNETSMVSPPSGRARALSSA